jgi:FAD/FMN-containing dehydrogenase
MLAMSRFTPAVLAELRGILGPKGVVEGIQEKAPYLVDFRDYFHGDTPLVARPETTQELSEVMAVCARHKIAVVPQGGNTGMMGAAIPSADGEQLVVSLTRMNKVRDIDPLNYTMTVEAGCVLADLQTRAAERDRLFPLSLAAEGSCQIGGNLSTNAGGTAVLRYGNAKELVLGLEVVLPDGRIWNGLRGLRKDNTGYDLKQLFLGSEGTLGIITAAVLKLFPMPAETCTAMVALTSAQAATQLLARAREASGDGVTTYEYMHRYCFDLAFAIIPGTTDPFADRYDHYALLELASGRRDASTQGIVEAVLETGYEEGWVLDAVIASSSAQAAQLWRIRESIPEANTKTGACVRHDVSVPVSRVAEFLGAGTALCERLLPGVRVTPFGHMGDGNIHFNLVPTESVSGAELFAAKDEITAQVHDLAMAMGGSFSAEHGIGQLKTAELLRYRDPLEIELMHSIKKALDPDALMNPGKVI